MYWLIVAVIIDGLVITANTVESILLLRKWKRLDRIEHILFSLCIADLTCGVVMFGQDVYQLHLITGPDAGADMTTIEALVLDSLGLFFILVSHFHVSAIAIERIVAVSMPLKYRVFTTRKCKALTISLVWALSLVFAPVLTITSRGHSYTAQLVVACAVTVCCTIVFLSYMTLTGLLIRRERAMRELLEPEMKRQMRDRQTTVYCLVFGVSFLVCTLPYAIGLTNPGLFHPFQILLLTAYHLVNPLVFFVKYHRNGGVWCSLCRRRSGNATDRHGSGSNEGGGLTSLMVGGGVDGNLKNNNNYRYKKGVGFSCCSGDKREGRHGEGGGVTSIMGDGDFGNCCGPLDDRGRARTMTSNSASHLLGRSPKMGRSNSRSSSSHEKS